MSRNGHALAERYFLRFADAEAAGDRLPAFRAAGVYRDFERLSCLGAHEAIFPRNVSCHGRPLDEACDRDRTPW